VDLVDVLSRVTHAALVHKLFKVGFTEETAHTAHVDCVMIRHVKQPFLQEASTSMRDHAVTLHLSETESTVTRTTFSRLSGQDLSGSSATSVDLIGNHMLQPLVIGGTKENLHLQSLSSESTVHGLVTIALVA
jgi:hypothetical protein